MQTVAAGLVARPEHMPGVSLNYRHWRGGEILVPRPAVYVDPRTNPAELPLLITPPPELYRAFDGDLDALVHHEEHGRRQLRDARRGRAPLGAKEVRRIHPWSEPRTLREMRGQRVRTFKAGARGIVGVQLEISSAVEATGFRRDHRETRIARRDGDLERAYPYGTYGARVHQGAPVHPTPPPDAVLAKPGFLLSHGVPTHRAACRERGLQPTLTPGRGACPSSTSGAGCSV